MTPYSFISVLFATYICYVQGQSSCQTPSSGAGTCKSVYECEPLLAILNNPNKSKQDIDHLRKSACGFQGSTPKVCCPESCFDADGLEGTCVSIYSCPALADLLKPPVSSENLALLQNSRCQGPEQYSVCCANSAPVNNGNGNTCQLSAAPPGPRTKCCGRESGAGNRIVGGNSTTVDQYPWLVLIEYVKGNKIKLLCGGSLISGKYVLTAGHCVAGAVLNSGTPRNIRLGEYDYSNEGADCTEVEGGGMDCTEGIIVIPIDKTIPHPEYHPNNRLKRNDIALIRMTRVAPYTDFIRPICLPTIDHTLNPPARFDLFAAGWGAVDETKSFSSIKLHVDLPFKTKDQCETAYSSRNLLLWRGQLCAGGDQGKDSCKGDSGGPLMFENGKIWEVIGVVSFGPTPCGQENIPGVYTKVFEYNAWIRSQINP